MSFFGYFNSLVKNLEKQLKLLDIAIEENQFGLMPLIIWYK